MKVVFDEAVPGVQLPEGSVRFAIRSPKPSRFIMEPEARDSLPKRLVANYSRVQLVASDILSANDEARARLKPLGGLLPTYFWFIIYTAKDKYDMYIEDRDPSNHRVISIGGEWRDDAQKAAFTQTVADSKYTEKMPYWRDGDLYVRLKPAFAHPTQRLATYTSLLELL